MKKNIFLLQLLSAFLWIFIGLNLLFWSLLEILISPINLIDRKRKLIHWLSTLWGRSCIALNPFWSFDIQGLENLDKKKTYVLVANHQSLGDIFLTYYLNTQFKWLAKDVLFKIPFIGWAMSLSGYVRLRRGEHGSVRKSFEESLKWLERGMSILIFPEGTRSETGEMRPFKNGAFKLAERANVPILPLAIYGTRQMLPKGDWVFRQKVKGGISVLPAIDPGSAEGGLCGAQRKNTSSDCGRSGETEKVGADPCVRPLYFGSTPTNFETVLLLIPE